MIDNAVQTGIDYMAALDMASRNAYDAVQCATAYTDRVDRVEGQIAELQNKLNFLQQTVNYTQNVCQEFVNILIALGQLREEATETSMSQENFDSRLAELLFGNS